MSWILPSLFACVFIGCSVTHVLARKTDNQRLAFWTKPLLMPLLLSTFLTAASAASLAVPRLQVIIAVLLLYTLGDICLLYKGHVQFLVGMVSFMIGHILYMYWFTAFTGIGELAWGPMGVVAAVCLVILIPLCKNIIACKLKIGPGLCVYAVMMSIFCIIVSGSWGSGPVIGTIVACAGAGFYAFSDGIISSQKMGKPIGTDVSVMTTYIIANVLLLGGIWILSSHPNLYVVM